MMKRRRRKFTGEEKVITVDTPALTRADANATVYVEATRDGGAIPVTSHAVTIEFYESEDVPPLGTTFYPANPGTRM